MAYAQQVMCLQFPISDDKRVKKLREKYPVLDLSTFHYKEKPDTILMFDQILKEAWNEEDVQFKDSSSKITYCIYGKPSGKIQVFTINIDSEISDTDKQKILHASKKVLKKHKLPTTNHYFHYCVSSKL